MTRHDKRCVDQVRFLPKHCSPGIPHLLYRIDRVRPRQYAEAEAGVGPVQAGDHAVIEGVDGGTVRAMRVQQGQ